MRKVVPNGQVAHLWANRVQDEARSAKGSMFFEGPIIYSYGYHYPIAVLTGCYDVDGREIVLFNSRRVSVTTSGHWNLAWRALDGKRKLEVPFPEFSRAGVHEANTSYLRGRFERMISSLKRMRSLQRGADGGRNWFIDSIRQALVDFNLYAAIFAKSKERLTLPDDFDAITEAAFIRGERHHERERARATERARQWELFMEKTRKVEEANLEAWIRGEYHGTLHRLGRVYLRMKGSSIVQTSLGAEVPVEDAKRAYAMIRRYRALGLEFHGGGALRVGGFEIRDICADGTVRIGCHTIHLTEILDFARRAGWESEAAA